MSAPWDYKVLIDELDDETPCTCGSCSWSGRFDELIEIGDCSLTPGDASPAGRCPDCELLVYADRPKDRAINCADEMLALLRTALDVTDVMQLATLAAEARKLIAGIDGKKP